MVRGGEIKTKHTDMHIANLGYPLVNLVSLLP